MPQDRTSPSELILLQNATQTNSQSPFTLLRAAFPRTSWLGVAAKALVANLRRCECRKRT